LDGALNKLQANMTTEELVAPEAPDDDDNQYYDNMKAVITKLEDKKFDYYTLK